MLLDAINFKPDKGKVSAGIVEQEVWKVEKRSSESSMAELEMLSVRDVLSRWRWEKSLEMKVKELSFSLPKCFQDLKCLMNQPDISNYNIKYLTKTKNR